MNSVCRHIIILFALFSFIALHILGVQMSLGERCADVLINLPLLTDSLTKLLSFVEVKFVGIYKALEVNVAHCAMHSGWLKIDKFSLPSWDTTWLISPFQVLCSIIPAPSCIGQWESLLFNAAVWGYRISWGWTWEIPQISVPGTYPLEISWYCAKIVLACLAVTQSKLTEVTNSRQDLPDPILF